MKRMYKSVQRWYDKNLDIYLKSGDILMKKRLDYFLGYVPRGGRVIDIGSGTGRDVEYFAKQGRLAIGIDFSEKMVEFSKKTRTVGMFKMEDVRSDKINYKKGSIDGVWDSSSLFTHSSFKDICNILHKVNGWLKKNGVFGVIVMKKNKSVILKNTRKYVFNEFSKGEVFMLLELNGLGPFYFQEFRAHNRKWIYVVAKKTSSV